MKKNFISALVALTAAILLMMGCIGFAEGTTEAADVPSAQQEASLEDAQAAYRDAKDAVAMTEFEKELAEMVANGQLTQEQADLLLKAAQDAAALQEGTCPNCGYEFSFAGRKGMGHGMGKGMNTGRNRRH